MRKSIAAMSASHAPPSQNQIASLRMREHDAIELPSAPFDAISPMQGLGSYLPTVGAIVAGAIITPTSRPSVAAFTTSASGAR